MNGQEWDVHNELSTGLAMNTKAIIFDFDGVIVESLDIKTEAFSELFRDEGIEVAHKVVAHHRAHGGMPRAEKFAFYYEHFLRRPLSSTELDTLCTRFRALVLERVAAAPWVPGAVDALEFCRSAGYLLFLASATPQEEIEIVIQRRGIDTFFENVFGAPIQKSAAVKLALNQGRLHPQEVVLIGDSVADLQAAEANRVRFLARDSGNVDWQTLGHEPMLDLSTLAARVQAMAGARLD